MYISVSATATILTLQWVQIGSEHRNPCICTRHCTAHTLGQHDHTKLTYGVQRRKRTASSDDCDNRCKTHTTVFVISFNKTTHSAVVVLVFQWIGRMPLPPALQKEWAFTHGADSARIYSWLPYTTVRLPSTVLIASVEPISAPLGGSIWRDNLRHAQTPLIHKTQLMLPHSIITDDNNRPASVAQWANALGAAVQWAWLASSAGRGFVSRCCRHVESGFCMLWD